jgi:energy-coupling factor transporter transmembrane protein EcfT
MEYIVASFLLVASVLLFCCNKLSSIPYIPITTPLEWCESQPCIEIIIFSLTVIIAQPSSTLFVYLLGFLTIAMGRRLVRKKPSQHFVLWWGIALILWGIGVILAGTSYQAFSYEIKYAGGPFCI